MQEEPAMLREYLIQIYIYSKSFASFREYISIVTR